MNNTIMRITKSLSGYLNMSERILSLAKSRSSWTLPKNTKCKF